MKELVFFSWILIAVIGAAQKQPEVTQTFSRAKFAAQQNTPRPAPRSADE